MSDLALFHEISLDRRNPGAILGATRLLKGRCPQICLRAAEIRAGAGTDSHPYTVADLAAQVYDIATQVTTIPEAIELLCQQA